MYREMNGKGMVLLAVAVVAVGTFALPSTVSLFTGQHNWYDLSPKGNDVPCEKCHADIAAELDNSGAHRNLTCAMCHRTPFNNTYNLISGHYEPGSSITYASGEGGGSTLGEEAHAASTIECMDCHGVKGDLGVWYHSTDPEYEDMCWKCHGTSPDDEFSRGLYDFISAGGFGFDTTYPPRPPDTGEYAAHKQFVLDAIEAPLMEGSNEACIACHTHIPVKINWKHAYSLEFNASYDEGVTFPPTHFNVSGWKANGTAPNIESYGNHSGGANVSHWPSGNVTYWG